MMNIPCPPAPATDWDQIVAFAFPVFLAGMAIGVMLMAVLQGYARRRKNRLLSSMASLRGGLMPPASVRRWNGRYPQDKDRWA